MANPQRMMNIKLGGNEQIVWDQDLITGAQTRAFRMDIEKAVEAYDERMDKIQADFKALADKFSAEAKKKDAETDEAHEKRLKKLTEKFQEESKAIRPPEDNYWLQDFAFDLLKVVARMVGQEHKVTRENFDGAPWKPIKTFLAKELLENEIGVTVENQAGLARLFLPPQLND